MKKTSEWTALQHDLEDATKKLAEAHKAYEEAKKEAHIWRDDFLESLAEAKAEKNGTKVELERKKLTTVSKQRRQARNINECEGNWVIWLPPKSIRLMMGYAPNGIPRRQLKQPAFVRIPHGSARQKAHLG